MEWGKVHRRPWGGKEPGMFQKPEVAGGWHSAVHSPWLPLTFLY